MTEIDLVFGYVRPFEDQLKIGEYKEYKSVYCALCRELGGKYGFLARNLLSYDAAFLAILLDCGETKDRVDFRCPLHPLKKRPCRNCTDGISRAADVNVILAWHKFDDTAADERGIKKIAAIAAKFIFARAYKKACAALPDFAAAADKKMRELRILESENQACMDAAADCFAQILKAAVCRDGAQDRIFAEILYNIGRWIYITDACDDLEADLERKRYNPLAAKYDIKSGALSAEQKKEVEFTLECSLSAAAAAYELLDVESDDGILRNILYYGLAVAMKRALYGADVMRKEKIK